MEEWRGYWPAAPTPFGDDGSVDEEAWQRLIDQYLADGVHGLLINGTAGEWTSQTASERCRNVRIVAERVAGLIPVIAGCTAYTAGEVIDLAGAAASAGADGVLCTPPPYLRPEPDDVIAFFGEVGAAVSVPLLAYNWPRGTGVDIAVADAEEILKAPNVVGFKNSTPDLVAVIDYLEAFGRRCVLFCSVISRRGLALMQEFGGSGYIDGGGLGARFAVPFFEAYWQGDLAQSRAVADSYSALTRSLVRDDFGGMLGSAQAQLKAAMRLLGQPGGTVRRPLRPLEDDGRLDELADRLRAAGLLT